MTETLPAPLDVKLMNLTASVLLACFVLSVLAVGALWVLRHPAFAIERIVVEGDLAHNNAVTLRANVAPHLTGNFFTLDLAQAREAFEKAPWVRHVKVRREYPGRLHVLLQEHDAEAFWGPETGSALLNSDGEVFEANTGDIDPEDLPRLQGPAGQSKQVLDMYRLLKPVFAPIGRDVAALELTVRGRWRATLDTDAVVELGGGSTQEVLQRTQRFVKTLTQVAARNGRRVDALESADLRHADGYALRLRGVSTISAEAAAKAVRKK